jgi:hypothetical protein
MQAETFEISTFELIKEECTGILSEIIMKFSENSEINDGMCSCVCISDEGCCGCLIQ